MLGSNEILEACIKRSGLRIDYICEKLGISVGAFVSKRKGNTSFKVSEVVILKDLLQLTDEEASQIFLPQKLGLR